MGKKIKGNITNPIKVQGEIIIENEVRTDFSPSIEMIYQANSLSPVLYAQDNTYFLDNFSNIKNLIFKATPTQLGNTFFNTTTPNNVCLEEFQVNDEGELKDINTFDDIPMQYIDEGKTYTHFGSVSESLNFGWEPLSNEDKHIHVERSDVYGFDYPQFTPRGVRKIPPTTATTLCGPITYYQNSYTYDRLNYNWFFGNNAGINFNTIKIKNFLSIGNEEVEIDFKNGLNIITGINKDKQDRRNGVGKSTIADAIHFAIFGETIRELSKDFIVNAINKKNTVVQLNFSVNENNEVKQYKVVRKLKPTKCYLFVDDVDLTESTIPNTNKKIKNIVSGSPEVFQNCVIMSLNTTLPFMAQRRVEKRKFIEGILNLEIFSEMLNRARSEYNDVQKKYEHAHKDYDHSNNILTLLKEQKENIVKSVIEQKEKILNRVSVIEKEIEENKNKIEPIDRELVERTKEKIIQINEKLEDISSKISDVKTNITRHDTEISFYQKQIDNIGTEKDVCPTCLHEITSNDREHIHLEKEKLNKDILNRTEDIESLKKQVKSLKNLKKDNLDVKDKINVYISNVKNTANNNKLAKSYIKNLSNDLDSNNNNLNTLKEKETSVEVQDLESKIKNKLIEVEELEKNTNDIHNDLEVLSVVKYILSEEGVKSFIVKKILDVLNNRLAYYLQKMDANCLWSFNELFEEKIINEKGEDCSYFNFSGAERKNIDLAILFTFMDMRRLQGEVAYNIVIFDELLDSSLDEKGVELVLSLLNERVE